MQIYQLRVKMVRITGFRGYFESWFVMVTYEGNTETNAKLMPEGLDLDGVSTWALILEGVSV